MICGRNSEGAATRKETTHRRQTCQILPKCARWHTVRIKDRIPVEENTSTRICIKPCVSCNTRESRKRWCRAGKPGEIPVNQTIAYAVQKAGSARPTYGTGRMAAVLSRPCVPVNRKQVQRTYRKRDGPYLKIPNLISSGQPGRSSGRLRLTGCGRQT